MAALTTLALVAGTAFAVVETMAGANAQSRQAALMRQQVETQKAFAKAEEQKLRRRQSKQLSARSALLAARGIDPSAGSALLLQEESAAEAEFDALLARAGAQVRTNELDVKAQNATAAASITRRRALLSSGSQIRSTGTTVANRLRLL